MKKTGGMRGIGGLEKWAKYIHLKGKIAGKTDKSHGKTKEHEGKQNNPGAEGAHERASQAAQPYVHHHVLPIVAPAHSVLPLSERCVLVLRLGPRALDNSYWVILGRFLLSSLIHMASKDLLILWFRLLAGNSTKMLKHKQRHT